MKSFLRWILAFSALMPLAFSNAVLYPYVSGKSMFFRGLLFVVAATFTYLFIVDRSFQKEMGARALSLWKMPLVKAVAASWALLGASTIFAFDRYAAFFGTVIRGEGFIGLTAFYAFFLFAVLVFQKKDWSRFFSLNLAAGWIMFVVEIVEVAQGQSRPTSLVDNAIPLAVYFLSIIVMALIQAEAGRRERDGFRRFASWATAGMALIGMFLTESRGVVLAAMLGLVLSLCAFAYWKRNEGVRARRAARAVTIVVIAGVLFGGLFAATRKSEVWQHVPGLNRIASSSLSDASVQARVLTTEISLKALAPKNESVKTMLLGWGWDNYLFAWQKYYDPKIYNFDSGIFDRPHDKLLDELVMTGALDFLAYMAIWWLFLREIAREGKTDPYLAAVLLFWAIAYFIQNLSAFDTLVTYLMFFSLIGYAVSLGEAARKPLETNDRKK